MWTTLGHFCVVLHHAVMCPQQVSCNFKSQWKGAHTQWRHTHMRRSHIIYSEIPYRHYLVDYNNMQTRSCTERWMIFNTAVKSLLICNNFGSYLMERDQFASVFCGHNHMWLTCLPLKTVVLPWWAPQAKSTQTFPGHVIRLGQWVTDLALKSTHKCIHMPTLSISMNKQGYELYKEREGHTDRKWHQPPSA